MGEPAERSDQQNGPPGAEAGRAAEYGLPASIDCSFCGSSNTELHSPFGSAVSVATYWCRSCRTAFEWIKWS